MKFSAAKAWPHPVLRPTIYGDDYPNAEFQVEIDPRLDSVDYSIHVEAEFELSDPTLLELVDQRKAKYALLVEASKSRCRRVFSSFKTIIEGSFSPGELSGEIRISAYLVCIVDLKGFQAKGWHTDFGGLRYDIAAGSVLAEYGPPAIYWADALDEKPIGSIFKVAEGNVPDGCWKCRLDGDYVHIVMSESDYRRFDYAYNAHSDDREGQYLMNGLYLPALITALYEADQNPGLYQEHRWFDAVNRKLEDAGCERLGTEGADRLTDAQKLFDHPFSRMPIIADAQIDQL